MTLAEVRIINTTAITFIKEHPTATSEIEMVAYGENGTSHISLLHSLNSSGERKVCETLNFYEIIELAEKLGEIYRVEILTDSNISLTFASDRYQIIAYGEVEIKRYSELPKYSIEGDLGCIIHAAIRHALWNA